MPNTFLEDTYRDFQSVEPGVKRYHIEYTSGAVGAIPAALSRARGIKTIVRTGVGVVVITLNQPAINFVDFVGFVEQAAPAAGGACFVTVVDAVASTPSIVTVTFRTNAMVAVDTLAGDVVYISFSVLTVV